MALTIPIPGRPPASRIAAWRQTIIVIFALAFAVLAAPPGSADDAVAARERGSAVIDAFVDHYRRTGDPTSKLAELNAMAPPLVAAVRSFMARGDNAGAAQTLIPLGDIHRMQGRWELSLTAYRMAENFARQAADPTLIARALKTQAQVESSGRDYGTALAHAEEALALSRALPDKKLFADVLLVLAEVQVKLADFAGAADSVNQALTIADERRDDALRFYALLSRADIWMTMGFCDGPRLEGLRRRTRGGDTTGLDGARPRDGRLHQPGRVPGAECPLHACAQQDRRSAVEPVQAEGRERRAGQRTLRHVQCGGGGWSAPRARAAQAQ
jgi:hypothetical protein